MRRATSVAALAAVGTVVLLAGRGAAETAIIDFGAGTISTADTTIYIAEIDSLGDLEDIDLAGIMDGYVLSWDSAGGHFEFVAQSGGGGDVSSSNIEDLANVSDNFFGDGYDEGDVLAYVMFPSPGFVPIAFVLNQIADVSTTGATAGQVLEFNGTSWAPATDDTGGGGGSSDVVLPLSVVAGSFYGPDYEDGFTSVSQWRTYFDAPFCSAPTAGDSATMVWVFPLASDFGAPDSVTIDFGFGRQGSAGAGNSMDFAFTFFLSTFDETNGGDPSILWDLGTWPPDSVAVTATATERYQLYRDTGTISSFSSAQSDHRGLIFSVIRRPDGEDLSRFFDPILTLHY